MAPALLEVLPSPRDGVPENVFAAPRRSDNRGQLGGNGCAERRQDSYWRQASGVVGAASDGAGERNGSTDTAAALQAAAPAAPAAAQPAPDPPAAQAGDADRSARISRPPTCSAASSRKTRASSCQPFVDVGIAAAPGVTINAGLWNSLHSGPSGSDNDDGRSAWYETDFYASATFQVGKVKPGVLYTSYTSPNDAFNTVQELARRPRLRRQRQHGPAESQGDPRLRARRPGRRRQQQGHLSELGVRPVAAARPLTTVPADAGHPGEDRVSA